MKVTFWGTRGSIAAAGPQTARYGGNTSCVELRTAGGGLIVLDAGTGIVSLANGLDPDTARIDLLLTHLHMDHIQGLGFFGPLYNPDAEVHIWAPPSRSRDLSERLSRYLAPPLFPVRLRDLPCQPTLHDVPIGRFELDGLTVQADLVSHPYTTLGYRIEEGERSLTYLPDHEPALTSAALDGEPAWISGLALATGADLLIHDAQYSDAEYEVRVGWGHSSVNHALNFARMAGVEKLVLFHYDPVRTDDDLDALFEVELARESVEFPVQPAREGDVLDV